MNNACNYQYLANKLSDSRNDVTDIIIMKIKYQLYIMEPEKLIKQAMEARQRHENELNNSIERKRRMGEKCAAATAADAAAADAATAAAAAAAAAADAAADAWDDCDTYRRRWGNINQRFENLNKGGKRRTKRRIKRTKKRIKRTKKRIKRTKKKNQKKNQKNQK